MLEKDFKETIINIKNEIINTQTQILSDANSRLINLYFKLGKIINDNSKWGDKLPWTHNIMLIEKIKDKNIRFWYANEAANGNWSKVVLDHQIDMKLYERKALPDKKNNFKNTLIEPQSDLVNDLQNVLLELGNGFSFIGNQYKLTVGNNDFFIDMLFYHLKLHCYIVVELKAVPFKPEFIGQLNFYLTALEYINIHIDLEGAEDNE